MKNIFLIPLTAILVFTLFEYLYPLKLLVVFFHESSHALTTWATGGTVTEFVIHLDQSGYVMSAGGNRFLALSSGYIGSLIWGLSILYASIKMDNHNYILSLLATVIVGLAFVFSADVVTLVFSLIMGAMMILTARFASLMVSGIILKVIGITSMIYVPYDIWMDTILNSTARSDAFMLAEEVGGTAEMWGMVWILISVVLILYSTITLVKVDNQR